MKLTEAIEILKIIKEDCARLNEPRSEDALKLGIEAIKRCQLKEPFASYHLGEPLPGETEE